MRRGGSEKTSLSRQRGRMRSIKDTDKTSRAGAGDRTRGFKDRGPERRWTLSGDFVRFKG